MDLHTTLDQSARGGKRAQTLKKRNGRRYYSETQEPAGPKEGKVKRWKPRFFENLELVEDGQFPTGWAIRLSDGAPLPAGDTEIALWMQILNLREENRVLRELLAKSRPEQAGD